jgi:hypothetical protein
MTARLVPVLGPRMQYRNLLNIVSWLTGRPPLLESQNWMTSIERLQQERLIARIHFLKPPDFGVPFGDLAHQTRCH